MTETASEAALPEDRLLEPCDGGMAAAAQGQRGERNTYAPLPAEIKPIQGKAVCGLCGAKLASVRLLGVGLDQPVPDDVAEGDLSLPSHLSHQPFPPG